MPGRLAAAWLLVWAPGLALAASGPVEAGRVEVRSAMEARNLSGTAFRHSVEQSMGLELESYQIQGVLIRGGSPRALLYAMIDAAGSITRRGTVSTSRGEAETAIRGVRRAIQSSDIDLPRDHWQAWFRSLAMARFNRARLILPPVTQPIEPFLRMVAEFADQYAVDLTLDLPPAGAGALRDVLRISPVIRAVYATTESTAATAEAVRGAGRYAVVETAPGAAVASGVPHRVLAPWKAGAGRPCAPGCEFVWTIKEGDAPVAAVKNSGAAGFEVNHSDLEAWSGFGYQISQSAAAPARKKTTVRKKTATTKKR